MKSGITSYLGINRSPSPVYSKYRYTNYGFEKLNKTSIRILNKSSNSYKKLQKNYINETSLVYIHKFKETDLKNTPKKVIAHKTDKMIASSFISNNPYAKTCDSSQRMSPIVLISSCSENNKIPKSSNNQRIKSSKEYNSLKSDLIVSFPEINIQNNNTKGKYFFESNNKFYVKNNRNKLKVKEINRDKVYSQVKKINELQKSFQNKEAKNKNKSIQVDQEEDISAWQI